MNLVCSSSLGLGWKIKQFFFKRWILVGRLMKYSQPSGDRRETKRRGSSVFFSFSKRRQKKLGRSPLSKEIVIFRAKSVQGKRLLKCESAWVCACVRVVRERERQQRFLKASLNPQGLIN